MKKMKNKVQEFKKLQNERGLTLVELLAVIVILGIIATIAFVMIGNVIENSKQDAQIANAQQMISSAKLYEASDGKDIENGVSLGDLQTGGFIEPVVDPWTKETGQATGKVTKAGDVYSVTLTSSKGTLEATESELAKGRDEVTIN